MASKEQQKYMNSQCGASLWLKKNGKVVNKPKKIGGSGIGKKK